jgi:alpha 1,2-mannosyltransferase
MDFISDDGGDTYNSCHCESFFFLFCLLLRLQEQTVWSNFEIGDMNFFRSDVYQKFFAFLDSTGGFYYEVSFCKH